MAKLDPNGKPPESLKAIHKLYQKASADALAKDTNVYDLGRVQEDVTDAKLRVVGALKGCQLLKTFSRFERYEVEHQEIQDVNIYEHSDLPGLQFLPSLLPQNTQKSLLSRLLHRDLSDPTQKNNVHFHHTVLYDPPALNVKHDVTSPGSSQKFSFFDFPPNSSSLFPAIDSSTHQSLTITEFLNRKLRWMTLGAQYDWTKKVYPEGSPPRVPEDIARLVQDLFPHTRPEAAIVNLYSPGDTLNIHRDVSEESDVGLVSLSVGCDGIFVAGLEEASTGELNYTVMRLKSGDAVYMSGPSRYAWHSVPQVLAGTCPPWLSNWPAYGSVSSGVESTTGDRFDVWRGWMANKRINLNVRQMKD
ncbi:MAG: hypothetical protein Q9166_000081 [cf. Caloplaca sp. 2 TL-2023]